MLEAETIGVAGVHLVELAGEEGGFVAAGGGPYLEDHILVVVRVAVDELGPYLLGQLLDSLLSRLGLFGKEISLFRRIGRRDQLPRLLGLLAGVEQPLRPLGTPPHPRVLLGDLGVAALVGVDVRVRKLVRERLMARERLLGKF